MFLVKLGDATVLAENFQVVGFGDPYKAVEFGLDLGIPIFITVQKLGTQVITEQRAAGRAYIPLFAYLDGEDVAALFVTVQGFHLNSLAKLISQ